MRTAVFGALALLNGEPERGLLQHNVLYVTRTFWMAPPGHSLQKSSSFDSLAGVYVGCAFWIARKTHLITAQLGEAAEPPRACFD
jgi:hypothetical protein